MNQRFFLALVLTAIVIVGTPLLFPGARRTPTPVSKQIADSQPGKASASVTSNVPARLPSPGVLPVAGSNHAAGDSTVVNTPVSVFIFRDMGATVGSVQLDSFVSRRPNANRSHVELLGSGDQLASYLLILDKDSIALDSVAFQPSVTRDEKGQEVTFSAKVRDRTLSVVYTMGRKADNMYLTHTAVSVLPAPSMGKLIIGLPRTLNSNEPDTLDDANHLAISYRPARGDVKSTGFSKLDTAETTGDAVPLNWVALRNKYFLIALRAGTTPFSQVRMLGLPRVGKMASMARADVTLPIGADGSAAFDIYAGPQDFERLQRLGGDLEQVNPYAGLLHGVVQPFATIVMRALLWMKRTTQLNYGWVLVLFGVIIRLALWPLNQSAMRTSIKMQRLQPELQAVQKKHGDDPQKQQQAIMKVYKDHGMSPLSPLMGCLPMLLPMPILFALYYVFQNTIEFRGVSFLWLPDISLRDPYFITPLLMGASMYAMSWISMRNSPPNPQAKMMSYMMPVVMTAVFFNFASGLNLYYAVQNIAAIPQQWFLARERGSSTANGPLAVASRRT